MATLTITLQNQTTSSNVFAYITGQAIDNNNALFLLSSDARTPYYPTSPSSTGTALAQNCAIPLGAPGNSVNATIPHIAGGRIWFAVDGQLTFLLNPGPGLVEPAVTNPSDPNINLNWGFCEFTWNSAQLFANISYVDFVSLPIALTLVNTSGASQHVTGMPANGLDTVCAGLQAQQAVDNAGWSSLIVKNPSTGANLRALSPNNGMMLNSSIFQNYFANYVSQVYSKFTGSTALGIDTQAQWGTVSGSVFSNTLNFGTDSSTNTTLSFAQPSTQDIFSCSTGAFTPSPSIEKGALIARLAAAFNRTVLLDSDTPMTATVGQYYANAVTNHYARILHAANADGRGYAFPFDDVTPTGGQDQSGAVQDGAPGQFVVAVGGGGVVAKMNVQS